MTTLNVFTVKTGADPDDPPGCRASAVKLGPLLGASMLGGGVYVLEPGESICRTTAVMSYCHGGDKSGVWSSGGRPGVPGAPLDEVDYHDGE